MKRLAFVYLALMLCVASVGCTGSSTKTVKSDGLEPEQIVDNLLKSMKSGNKEGVASLLTATARVETDKAGLEVQPPAMPNAAYRVMEAILPPEDPGVAHVSSIWSEGEDHFEIIWVLRQEQPGWRVAGMAMTISEDQDPLFLNFENPAEMLKLTEEAVQASSQTAATDGTATGNPATTTPMAGGLNDLPPPSLNPLSPVGQSIPPVQDTAGNNGLQPIAPAPTTNGLQPVQPLQPLQPVPVGTETNQARQPQSGFSNPIRSR